MRLVPALARVSSVAACLLPLGALAQYATPMRNIDNPDRQPYQESVFVTIAPPYVNNFAFFPTPAGKRVVVEWVSLGCSSTSASDVFPQVQLNVTRSAGNLVPMSLAPMTRTGSGVFLGNVSIGQTALKAYSEPQAGAPDGGSGMYLNIFHAESAQTAYCTATIVGHLVTP